jgi:hypothetical protein
MKKSLFIGVLLIIFSACGFFSAYAQEANKQASAKEKAGLTIVQLVVATSVENRVPVGAAETFPATTEKVYCFLEAKDIPTDSEITFVWIYNAKEMLKTNMTLKAGPKWRTNVNKNLRGAKGDWKVEVRDASGAVLKDIKFKVE